MDRTMIVYLDDKGDEVPEEQATKINIVEYDEKGNRVKETYMVKSKELSEEEAKKYWSSVKVNPDSEMIKNSVTVEQKPNPIQDFLDSQKTK